MASDDDSNHGAGEARGESPGLADGDAHTIARPCLLWRIRGIDTALYAMFLRPSAAARWALDLHRDGRPFATYEHRTRDAAMRDARHSFLVCQVPPGASPLWHRTTWDGHALAVYISRHEQWWCLTIHRDGLLWRTGEFESEHAALTDAALTYEDCQRPPWPQPVGH